MFAAHPRPFRGIVRAHRARFPTHDDILSPIGVKFHSKCKRDARVFSPRRRGSSSSSFLQPHRRRQSLAETTRIRVIIKVAFPLRRCCRRPSRINHRLFLLLCFCCVFLKVVRIFLRASNTPRCNDIEMCLLYKNGLAFFIRTRGREISVERRFLAILLKNVLFLKQPDERKKLPEKNFCRRTFFCVFPHLSSSSSSSRDCCRKEKSLKKHFFVLRFSEEEEEEEDFCATTTPLL